MNEVHGRIVTVSQSSSQALCSINLLHLARLSFHEADQETFQTVIDGSPWLVLVPILERIEQRPSAYDVREGGGRSHVAVRPVAPVMPKSGETTLGSDMANRSGPAGPNRIDQEEQLTEFEQPDHEIGPLSHPLSQK